MKPLRIVAILFSLLHFTACTSYEYNRQAAGFRKRSAKAEAELDYRAHNYKIYSAMGVGHYYPGLDPDDGRRISIKHGEMMLSGTSDALESRSHANYVFAATGFASDYNKRKASLIAKSPR